MDMSDSNVLSHCRQDGETKHSRVDVQHPESKQQAYRKAIRDEHKLD